MEYGYLISLLVIGFLAHLVLISYSKEDSNQESGEEGKKQQWSRQEAFNSNNKMQ